MENISIEEEEEGKVKLNLLSVIYDFEEKKKPFLSSFFHALIIYPLIISRSSLP